MFMSEIITRVISEEGAPNLLLYQFIQKSYSIGGKRFSPLFHLKFMIDLSKYLGFYPNQSEIKENFLI